MEIIVTSYKYCRKSPCQTNRAFFDFASTLNPLPQHLTAPNVSGRQKTWVYRGMLRLSKLQPPRQVPWRWVVLKVKGVPFCPARLGGACGWVRVFFAVVGWCCCIRISSGTASAGFHQRFRAPL